MLDQNSESERRCIKGNDPLLLNDPQMVWVVHSGTLELFATSIEDGEPKGKRHYLFSVSAGEALFGTALLSQWGILAVAIEETELSPVALDDLAAAIAEKDESAIALVEGWSKHLGDFIGKNPIIEVPMNLEQTGSSHYLSLQKGHTLTCSTERVVWVQLDEGYARWMGMEDLKLEPTSPKLPLVPGMWVEAEDLAEVHVVPTAELEVDQIPASLAYLHEYFLDYVNTLIVKIKEQDFRRSQEREKLNREMNEAALRELAGVLHPQEAELFQEGTPLLSAAGAVCHALGININPPARSEDPRRVSDPLDAIARASRFRTRRVRLVRDWWREEHGPLLAYTNSDKSPVALLPDKGDHYVLFDPVERTRTPVTLEVAQMLSPEAQMFYRPLPPRVRNSLELFEFSTRGNIKELLGVVVLGILGTLLGMVTPQATAMLVNDIIPDSNRTQLLQIGLALFAAAIGQAAFQMSQAILSLRVENSADANLQPAIWDKLLSLKPAFFRSYSSGDLLTRLLAISQIRAKLTGATQRTLLSAMFSLLNLGLMFFYSWQLALVGVGITLIAVIVTVTSSILLIRKTRKQEAIDGEINGLTVELISGVSKLRVAAAEERAFAAWAKKYSQRTKLQAGIKRIDDIVSVFNEMLSLVSSILLFQFAIVFMAQTKGGGGLNVGTFLAFNSAFGIFISGVTDLSNTLTDLLGIVPLWERAHPIVQGMPESDLSSADPGRLTGKISLDHITFRYREDGPLILDDVTIHAEPGEFVAIVGPSGSGKSTVFRLLLGFETPLSGTVYYDGQDLAGLDVQAVRRQLGVVLQNGRINSGSIFDNLTSGALGTMDEAWEAARMSGFAVDIEQMPMGMHTVISEGGTNLSGGQRQRLLIARSILLKPKIILMDEATSALDNRTQAIVTESLDNLKVTRVVIAHRLSTIRKADRIYVLKAGRLDEVGSYEELINQRGLFERLVKRQID